MTSQDGGVELIRLSDGDNVFSVRVIGRRSPGILPTHDLLDAEVTVRSSFISGRLDICFYPKDLEAWSLALDALEAGRSVEWLDTGNGPVIGIAFTDEDPGLPIVTVEDASGSGACAVVPVAVDEGWVDEQRERLREVARTWPSEVVKTSPGTYSWRR